MPHNICKEGLRSDTSCDRTSQVIRPTYSCPCPTDIRHPVDVPKSLDKFGIFFLTFPGTFHPSCRHYRSSEIKKCGSDYITYIYLKSKIKLFIIDQKYKWVQSSIITIPREVKTPPDKFFIKVLYGGPSPPAASLLFFFLGNHLGAKATKICRFLT